MGGIPDTHLCGQLTGSDPLGQHPGAGGKAHPLEILIENDGHTHHQDQHVHELRPLMHSGNPVADVHSEAEAKVCRSAEDQANSHESLGAHPFHHESVQEAAEAVDERADGYHYAEAGVGDAVLGRQARHGDGEVLPYKIIDGIDHHRNHDGAPLPVLETLVGRHIVSSVFIVSICAFARRMRVRTVLSGSPVSSAISLYCSPSTRRIRAILR